VIRGGVIATTLRGAGDRRTAKAMENSALCDHASAAARRFRVLFFSPVPDFKGGAERTFTDLLEMDDLDMVLAVPAPGPLGDCAKEHGVPVVTYQMGAVAEIHRPLKPIYLISGAWAALRCARQIAQLCRAYDCRFVHSNGMKTHVIAGIARWLFKVRVIQHLHDIPYTRLERLVWRLLRMAADCIVIVSPPCWPGRVLPRNVCVIPDGIRIAGAAPAWREPRRPIRLGFVGRFHPNKGLDLLVDWLVAARDAGVEWSLVMRGRAAPEDSAYWERIQRRFAETRISDQIAIDAWRDWQTDWRTVYADIDVLLVPSINPEPLGRVVMEGLGSGVPSIAYPAGGIPMLIKHGVTGYLADTPSSFVTVLKDLISHPENFHQIRRCGYASMRDEFSIAALHRRMRDAYQLVAS
jgi:glycosyltransferase involved in cell wall biosynthesis